MFGIGKAKSTEPLPVYMDEVEFSQLLAIVESGFGTFAPFNAIVRNYFSRQLVTAVSSQSTGGQPRLVKLSEGVMEIAVEFTRES